MDLGKTLPVSPKGSNLGRDGVIVCGKQHIKVDSRNVGCAEISLPFKNTYFYF